MDDAFIPPLMNESVAVIVKYPKYYVFDLAEGDVTDSGYVKDVWADISEAPTAVFSNVPMGYIIFYHVSELTSIRIQCESKGEG